MSRLLFADTVSNSIVRSLQTSIILLLDVERRLNIVYVFDNCCKRNLLPPTQHQSGFSCSSVVAPLFIPLCIAYTLARLISAGPLAPTVCRNHNSSCSSCDDDVEHRWLTSGGAINRGAVPVIGAGNTAASQPVGPANRRTSAAVDGRSASRPSALSRRRVRPAAEAAQKRAESSERVGEKPSCCLLTRRQMNSSSFNIRPNTQQTGFWEGDAINERTP